MKSWLKFCWQGVRFCGACVLSFAVWTLWLALILLLGLQTWIATSHELAVPGFLLRKLEERLAVSHVHASFGRAHFDPSGRILIEDLHVSLPGFNEPVARSHAVYVELDPLALLAGKFEPQSLQLSGASLAVPAMLSPSGQSMEIMRDLDATFRFRDSALAIEHLTARVAGIDVTGRGALHLTPHPGAKVEPLPLADYLSSQYPDLCRQLVHLTERLAVFDQPQLQVELTASNTRGAIATVKVLARGMKLETPYAVQATGIHAATRFPLQGDAPVMAPLTLSVDDLQMAGGISLHAVHARLRGSLKPALLTFEPREAVATAARLSARGFTFNHVSARLMAGPLPRLTGEVLAECAGAPIALHGRANLEQKTAAFRFDGALAPALLEPIGEAIHHDVRPFIGFGAPVQLDADITFAAGWKFTRLAGHVAATLVDAHHVPIDAGGGEIEFDGQHFIARHAFARLGENFARGSFEQDFATQQYRFLLEGRLRPLAISGWFGKWWPGFFNDFEFPAAPPEASVDVSGWWRNGRLSTVFVYADTLQPVVHAVKFDHARTLLFIRPNFYDGLELFVTLGAGSARGTFTRQIDPASFALVGMDLNFDSTLSLDIPGKIFGPIVADQLAPFWFAHPPTVKLNLHFDGPASPGGVHQSAHIEARSSGAFAFHDFPLSNLSFRAAVNDDEVLLDRVEVNFAGGTVTGRARVWGREAERRLGFDYSLRDASLGQAVSTLESFAAKRKGLPPPAPGKFVQDKASVKLDLAATAEGHYDDPYSYRGSGNGTLAGTTLGEVRMLGLLSQLLSFTSLRFTSARANFRIEGARLVFPEVKMTGANSAIDAHGSYALDRHELDFTARVNPFQESTFIPAAMLGAVLTPFSSVLEVKLTGLLDDPKWAFVNGPTNFLRNLAKPGPTEPPPPVSPNDYLRR